MKKSIADHPETITISTYWKNGKFLTLREALPHDHPENLYNWFCREYPDLDPKYYDIGKPKDPTNRCPHCKCSLEDVENDF